MTLYRMFDAAYPPISAYPGCDAVAGYLGPEGNTPHVWTREEWQRFGHLAQFPIWVGSGRVDGTADGEAMAAAMHALGWAPGRPQRRFALVDMETSENPGYLDAFGAVIWAYGYQTGIYESMSTAPGNPVKEGLWIALWNGVAQFPPGAHVMAHQYAPDVPWQGGAVDLSAIDDYMMSHAGQGPRQ